MKNELNYLRKDEKNNEHTRRERRKDDENDV